MAKAIMIRGPQPPHSNLGFCAVCAMLYKGHALEDESYQRRVAEAPENEYTWVEMPEPNYDTDGLEPAVAWGVYPPLGPPAAGGNGLMPLPVPLCWSHLMPIRVSASGVLPATAADGAAMGLDGNPRLPGGAVDLSQRRRK